MRDETRGRRHGLPRGRSVLVSLVLIVLLGALAYSNTFHSPFVFDDIINIVESPIVKSLDIYSSLDKAKNYSDYPEMIRRYVGYLTFALNYAAHGLDVRGYHAVNLAIHLCSAFLVYWLVLLTLAAPALEGSALSGRAPRVALLAAALFVAHPAQTQAITYSVQRLASLATLFYLLSLAAYARHRLSGGGAARWGFYLLSIAAALLGMKTKEVAFTVPLAIALYEGIFFRGAIGQRLLRLAPLGLTMLVVPLTQILISSGDMQKATVVANISRAQYLMTEPLVLMTYLRLLAFPVNQNLLYDYPVAGSMLEPGVLLSVLALAGLGILGVYLYRRSRRGEPGLRVMAFGIAWFFLTLSVESTLVPLHPIFEHRLYLPSAGVFLGVAAGAFLLIQRVQGARARRALVALMVVVPMVLGAGAFARNRVWTSRVALWEDVVAKAPNSAVARQNLGKAYVTEARADEALQQYRRALSLDLEHYQIRSSAYFEKTVRINLGNIYAAKHQPLRAIEEYRRAISLEDDTADGTQGQYLNSEAYYNVAVLYSELENYRESEAAYLKAIEHNAANVDAHNNLGVLYFDRKDFDRALAHYRAALDIEPNNGIVHYNLGEVYYALGERGRSVSYLEKAAALVPTLAEAHYLLGKVYRELGRESKSMDHLRRADLLNGTAR